MFVLVGDIHSGIAADDPWYENNLLKTWEQIIQYCIDNNIKTIVQTGDWFDVRRGVTQTTMNFSREKLIPMVRNNGINLIVLVGNHDSQFKNTLFPNSVREVLGLYDCVTVVDTPQTINLDGHDFDMIPWLCESNNDEILSFIRKSKSEYCVGHWELSGYYFYKNMKSSGYEPDFLKKYKQVYSGHFHTVSDGGNVHYIGTPLTLTANDEDETRGFYEFNNGYLKFIANEKIFHRKILYPMQKDVDLSEYADCEVRLFCNSVDSGFDKFETELTKIAHSVRTTINVSVDTNDESSDIVVKTTYDVMINYVDKMDKYDDVEKKTIKAYLSALWNEAQNQ